MAPKKGISKHSRAARRGQEDPFESSETKELASIPRLEKTDTISPFIRSSVNKNQQLLNQKMNKSSRSDNKLKPGDNIVANHLNKKKQHMVSKTIRSKHHKFQNIDGRLGKKIENALNRKKRIANLRKTGWDKINELAKDSLSNDLISTIDSEKKTKTDIEEELAEEMMDGYEEEAIVTTVKNPFEVLGDEE